MERKKPLLLVTAQSFVNTDQLCRELERRLQAHYSICYHSADRLHEDELIRALRDAEAWIVGREPVSRRVLAASKKLRLVSKYGVGLDNVDFVAAAEFGVTVLYKPGVNAKSVAEHTIGLMLSLSRNIMRSALAMKQGLWLKQGGSNLSEKTVAVIGCGAVGSALLPLLKAFACRLLIVDIVDKSAMAAQFGARQLDLEDALAQADFVSLHVPLTEITLGMIGREQLARMRSSSFLINTSRGEVVCQAELADALRERVIAGAALDVFEGEPEIDKRLTSLENVVCTAHTAGNSWEAKWAMGCAAIECIEEAALAKT